MTRTKQDELYVTLGHLLNAKNSVMRTEWTTDRQQVQDSLAKLAVKVRAMAKEAK